MVESSMEGQLMPAQVPKYRFWWTTGPEKMVGLKEMLHWLLRSSEVCLLGLEERGALNFAAWLAWSN